MNAHQRTAVRFSGDHKPLRKAQGLVFLAGLGISMSAAALPVDFGPFSGSLDTTVSLGGTWRMQDRDSSLVGIANGGSARSVNEDDGNLNYDKHDLVSLAVKATHDLELKYEDYGLFTRVTYFYDHAQDHKDFPTFYNTDNTTRNTLGPVAEDRLISDFKLLDLFAYTDFNVGDQQISVRAGNQVINWGESTFIGNSINVINPVDVAQLRTPGAEIKEALRPSPMLWASMDLGDALKVEALWMSEYERTLIDPRGSFFSSNDVVSDDGDKVIVSFGRRNDQHEPFVPPAVPNADPNQPPTPVPDAQVWLERERSPDIRDERRQFGFAFRYFADQLNNTEFGLYYLNYHSRTPFLSGVRGGATNVTSTTPTCSTSAEAGCRATYYSEFPENIEMFGLSFNTDGPYGVALQGEYSFRPEQPVQLATPELAMAILGLPNNVTGTGVVDVNGTPTPEAALVPAGTRIQGYRELNVHQIQTTATKAFGPTFGADQFVLVGEVGYNYQNLSDGLLFAAPGASLPAPGSANAANGSFQTDGYATKSSWGYRAVSRMDFENVIDAVQLSPRLVFAHDVHGAGPNFNQGVKALQLGVAFNYLQRWQADIGYTVFSGGRTYAGTDAVAPPPGQSQDYATSANPNKDRDFLAASISYAF